MESFRDLYVQLTGVLSSMDEAASPSGSRHQAKKLKEDPISYFDGAPIAFRESSDCVLTAPSIILLT